MITITKGQVLKDNADLEVFSPSGSYDENDLIQCTEIGGSVPICAYEAVYIERGNEAYRQTVMPT